MSVLFIHGIGKCGCCGAKGSYIPIDDEGTPRCPVCGGDFNYRKPSLLSRVRAALADKEGT